MTPFCICCRVYLLEKNFWFGLFETILIPPFLGNDSLTEYRILDSQSFFVQFYYSSIDLKCIYSYERIPYSTLEFLKDHFSMKLHEI